MRAVAQSALGAAALAAIVPQAPVAAQRQVRKVFVRATDARGAAVLDLGASDFVVHEGGALRQVASARLSADPLRVALVVDSSADSERALNDIRAGLGAFLTGLPPEHEVGLLTIGRQMRIRVQPTMDRQRLAGAAREFTVDGGGTVLLDGIREINSRFLRTAANRWPVMVIVTTDGPERSGNTSEEDYLKFVQDLALRQTTVHTLLLQSRGGGLATDIGLNLSQNTGGAYQALLASTALPERLKALAERLADEHRRMTTAYEIDYAAEAAQPQTNIEVGVGRPGVTLQMSVRRPL